MLAAVARNWELSVEQVGDPVPGEGQVLVEPLACGICGSDLHVLEAQAAMPDLLPAMVLGHEFVGRVIDPGPRPSGRFRAGAVVTSVPYLDTPAGPQLIGLSDAVTGGMAEALILQESRLLEVPAGPDAVLAAVAEPLAVGLHAVRAGRVAPGDTALVVGCGPVGLAVIAALKADGAGPVVAADPSPTRRRLAEMTGADVVIDPAADDPYARWTGLAGPALSPSPLLGIGEVANTVVFECAGAPGILARMIESVPLHTRVVVVGVCTRPESISPATAVTKELSVQFVFAYRPEEFAASLGWILDGTVDVGAWVTARRPLAAAAGAVSDLRQPGAHCKILIQP